MGVKSDREFLRVPAQLRIRQRSLRADELEIVRREIESTERFEAGELHPRLLRMLERLESKLDLLLALLGPDLPETIESLEPRDVEISAAGLRMPVKEAPPVDAQVLVEFLLPGSSQMLRAIGRVRRHIPPRTPEHELEIAIAFEVINDADREAIVRFALESERRALRARAQMGEPS